MAATGCASPSKLWPKETLELIPRSIHAAGCAKRNAFGKAPKTPGLFFSGVGFGRRAFVPSWKLKTTAEPRKVRPQRSLNSTRSVRPALLSLRSKVVARRAGASIRHWMAMTTWATPKAGTTSFGNLDSLSGCGDRRRHAHCEGRCREGKGQCSAQSGYRDLLTHVSSKVHLCERRIRIVVQLSYQHLRRRQFRSRSENP